MPSTYYLRSTVDSAGYTEKSTDTANKTASDAGDLLTLSGAIGSSLVTPPVITNNSTNNEFWFHRAYATPALAAQSIAAGSWSVYTAPRESNSGLNHSARYYCYVLRAGANNATVFGPVSEATEDDTVSYEGRIHTLTGNAITLQDNDQIVLELWSSGTAGMTNGYTEQFVYQGTTEIADEVTLNTSPACKLVAPVNITEFTPAASGVGWYPSGRGGWW